MKQVEKIWAELSAKAQEVETPQESTELSEEVKVELAIGDTLSKMSLEASEANSKMNDVLDEMYVPLRRVEKAISELQSGDDAMPYFKDFMSKLQKLEAEYDEGLKKISQAESDLGVRIETPPQFDDALSTLRFLQKKEEDHRESIKELNAFVKKLR